jgi:hypothetical protein
MERPISQIIYGGIEIKLKSHNSIIAYLLGTQGHIA